MWEKEGEDKRWKGKEIEWGRKREKEMGGGKGEVRRNGREKGKGEMRKSERD